MEIRTDFFFLVFSLLVGVSPAYEHKCFAEGKVINIGTDFGNDSESSEYTVDTKSGLENGKFLLIESGERKNKFFKL